MDVVEIFVLAGLISEEDLQDAPDKPRGITLNEAAKSLGITEAHKVSLFAAIVGNLIDDNGETVEAAMAKKGRK